MNKTVILTITILTGLLILGFNFDEVFSAEPAPSGPVPIPYPVTTTKAIPSWVDTVMDFYLKGAISEREMLDAFDYLFKNNIMHMSQEAAQQVADLREENKRLQAHNSGLRVQLDAARQKTTTGSDFGSMIKSGESKDGSETTSDSFTFTLGDGTTSLPSGMQNSAQVQNQIESVIEEVNGLYATIKQLLVEIQAHMAEKPDSSNFPDTESGRDDFDKALSTWENQLRALNDQLTNVQVKIEQATQKLENLQGKLGPAQQKDQAEMERYLEEQRKALEAQMEDVTQTSKGTSSVDSSQVDRKLSITKQTNACHAACIEQMLDDYERNCANIADETGTCSAKVQAKYQACIAECDGTTDQQSSSYTGQSVPAGSGLPTGGEPGAVPSSGLDSLEDENESTMTEFLSLEKRYNTAEADVFDLANKLQGNLDAKMSLRQDISELREIISKDGWPFKFSYYDENGRVISVVLSTPREAMALVEKLEQSLQTMSDMSQMMQLELQDAMNKQQQMMQTLSAFMKSQHDTLKAIISNMRA
jgi:predicted  nucleic acid-binding Zn-ribbon protein